MSTTEAPSTETLHIAAVAPIAQPSVCSDSSVPVKSVVAAVADISGEFDTLSIGQNGDETSSKEEPNTKSDPAESLSVIQDEATVSSTPPTDLPPIAHSGAATLTRCRLHLQKS